MDVALDPLRDGGRIGDRRVLALAHHAVRIVELGDAVDDVDVRHGRVALHGVFDATERRQRLLVVLDLGQALKLFADGRGHLAGLPRFVQALAHQCGLLRRRGLLLKRVPVQDHVVELRHSGLLRLVGLRRCSLPVITTGIQGQPLALKGQLLLLTRFRDSSTCVEALLCDKRTPRFAGVPHAQRHLPRTLIDGRLGDPELRRVGLRAIAPRRRASRDQRAHRSAVVEVSVSICAAVVDDDKARRRVGRIAPGLLVLLEGDVSIQLREPIGSGSAAHLRDGARGWVRRRGREWSFRRSCRDGVVDLANLRLSGGLHSGRRAGDRAR
ncbi:hypothetical protein D3C71_1397260 [compost metagenome]